MDTRTVCATNRNLEEQVAAGSFREDLYYRLKVLTVRVPTLRERPGDVRLLIDYFIDKCNKHHRKSVRGIDSEVLTRLEAHPWPGNVRELENEIERALILTPDGDEITVDKLPPDKAACESIAPPPTQGPLERVRRNAEHDVIRMALHESGWNVAAAARRLGISRVGLTRKLKKLGIHRPT